MVNQKETLDRLNKDAMYEDKLAKDILTYCGMCKESITDMPEKVKSEVHELMEGIRRDSERHEIMIRELIEMVLNKGEREY